MLGLPVAANVYLSPANHQARLMANAPLCAPARQRRICIRGSPWHELGLALQPNVSFRCAAQRFRHCADHRTQGLAAHYDDHCVFVLQLSGRKRWRVAAAATGAPLPRLFAPRRAVAPGLPGAAEHTLTAGALLYVPRGFAHEALAEAPTAAEVGAAAAESCHVTFAVEVLPPFEAAAALHCAVRVLAAAAASASQLSSPAASSSSRDGARPQVGDLDLAAEALVHCALRWVSDRVPALRAALLVRCAISPPANVAPSCDKIRCEPVLLSAAHGDAYVD